MALTTADKIEQQKRGVKFCCYVDTNTTDLPPPDDCVLDYGDRDGCLYAARRRRRETCKYWRPSGSPDLALPAAAEGRGGNGKRTG